jgi:hypothetical protein
MINWPKSLFKRLWQTNQPKIMTRNELKTLLDQQSTPGDMLRIILAKTPTNQKLGPFTKATFIRGLLMGIDMINQQK